MTSRRKKIPPSEPMVRVKFKTIAIIAPNKEAEAYWKAQPDEVKDEVMPLSELAVKVVEAKTRGEKHFASRAQDLTDELTMERVHRRGAEIDKSIAEMTAQLEKRERAKKGRDTALANRQKANAGRDKRIRKDADALLSAIRSYEKIKLKPLLERFGKFATGVDYRTFAGEHINALLGKKYRLTAARIGQIRSATLQKSG